MFGGVILRCAQFWAFRTPHVQYAVLSYFIQYLAIVVCVKHLLYIPQVSSYRGVSAPLWSYSRDKCHDSSF